jgi:hypothetical protein
MLLTGVTYTVVSLIDVGSGKAVPSYDVSMWILIIE